jgi:prepilin-type processing-associated H-X9-DG protein
LISPQDSLSDGGSKVLLIEYEKIIADVVLPDGSDDFWEYVPKYHPGGIVNVLHLGGHVDTMGSVTLTQRCSSNTTPGGIPLDNSSDLRRGMLRLV